MTRLILVALAVLVAPDFSQGQIVWNGAGSDNNWTTPQDWVGGIAPASSANTFIRFQGTVQPTSFADTNVPWVLNRIDFESRANPAAHSFTLSGNQLSFQGTSPEIYSYSGAAQTINNDIDIPGGSFTIDGLTIPSLTVNGHLSGAGALTVGYASVFLTNSNTYNGVTTVGVPSLQGFLTISNGQALGSTANGTVVTLSSQLRLTGGITVTGESLSLSSGTGFGNGGLSNMSGNNTWTGNITLGFNSGLYCSNAGESLTITGNIEGANYILQAGGAGDIVLSGLLTNLNLSKYGTGTLTLSGPSSPGYQLTVEDGALVVATSTAVTASTTVQLTPFTGNINMPAYPTLQINQDTTIGGLSGYSSGGIATVQLGSHALTINQSFSSSYTGTITGPGSIVKTGAGVIELGAANTYSGATLINAGGIRFGLPGAIGGTGGDVEINTGALAVAGYAIDQSFLNRVDPASSGVIVLGVPSGNDLDFNVPNLANVRLDAYSGAVFGGRLTAAGSVYRLGGAANGQLALAAPGALSGSASVDITTYSAAGSVTLANNNAVTGGVTVSRGTLVIGASVLSSGPIEIMGSAVLSLSHGTINADSVTIDAGASLIGCGTINGDLINYGTVTLNCDTGAIFNGAITNYGTIRVLGGSLVANGAFTNNGLVDLITSPGTTLPGDFTNNGTVLYLPDVAVTNYSKSGTTFAVTFQAFLGHSYQLQRSASPDPTTVGWQNIGTAYTPSINQAVTLSDSGATGSSFFYRISISP